MPVLYGKALSGWSASGKLTAFDHTLNPPIQSQEAVRLQVDFGEKKAYYYTLQFSLIVPPDIPDGYLIRGKAKIDWAVEGNFVHREVTVLNGTVVSGIGQGATINIVDDTIIGTEVEPANIVYTATVQVARGTRPSIEHPPINHPYQRGELSSGGFPFPPYLVGTGVTLSFPVPENNGITSVYLFTRAEDNIATPNLIVGEVLGSGLQIAHFDYSSFNKWLPLPPGATSISLTNNNPTGILFITPLFGVEG